MGRYKGLAFKTDASIKLGCAGIRAGSDLLFALSYKGQDWWKRNGSLVEDMKLFWIAKYVPKQDWNSNDLGALWDALLINK